MKQTLDILTKKKRLSAYDWIKNLMTFLCKLGICFSTSIGPILHFPHQVKSVQWLICATMATVQRARIFWAVQTTKNAEDSSISLQLPVDSSVTDKKLI